MGPNGRMHARHARSKGLSLVVALGLLGTLSVTMAPPAQAAPIAVNTLSDGAPANDGSCTLREAIINANDDAQTWTSCAAGSGADVISFSVTGTILLGSELPSVASAGGTLTITGPGQASLTISGDVGNDNNAANNVRIITVEASATLNLSGVTIAEGHAAVGGPLSAFGGGIRNSGGTLTVTSSTFSGNTADASGAGIFNNNGTLDVESSTFTGNTAGSDGGGIWNVANSGTADVSSSTFSGNDATDGSGGGIFSGAGPLTVTSSTFTGNTAGSLGGGIQIQAGSLTVTGCTFTTNFASSGGGIFVDTTQPNTITGSTFTGNTAAFTGGISTDNDGGGIFTDGTLSVSNSSFSENDADDGGGIFSSGTLTVKGSMFSDNEADDDDGGGIFNDNGTLIVTGSSFSLNDANQGGGAILNTGTLDVTRSSFSSNSAGLRGAGISNDGGTLTVTDSTLSGNASSDDGGGILNLGTLTVAGSTLSDNTAAGDGGGIDSDAGTVTVVNSTFSGNTATAGDGGGIDGSGSTLAVAYSTFSGNGAGSEGGGIWSAGGVTLRATIVANNPAGADCFGPITDGGYNLSSDATCGFAGTSQFNTDPTLGPLADNGGPTETMALPASSPAVDVIPESLPAGAGCGTTIDTDQRGHTRPRDDLCDIGAYEELGQQSPPLPPPDVLSMSPDSGPVGTIVTISGSNLANATVRFNGVVAPVQSNVPAQIVVSVPPGATTGPVTVTTAGGQDTAGIFTVLGLGPTISGFSPSAGRVGTAVVIVGAGFTGAEVTFGGVPAASVVDAPTQITATVPPGAGTGPIEVTTDLGTATSAEDFVVRHAREVDLHFSKARGSVSVTDGWVDCASNVPVRLQRSSDGKFHTVASGTTGPHGGYRFGGIDEPGRYRVVAKRVTLSSGDVCVRARSPVVTA